MSQLHGPAPHGSGGALRSQAAARRAGQGAAYTSLDGQVIQSGGPRAGQGDVSDDDPTNTAMFLDESEENELVSVAPGTPMAFKKLGQVTVKSITRQRDSQTPGRAQGGPSAGLQRTQRGAGGSARYDNAESPSKKGRGGRAPLVGSRIPMPTSAQPARAAESRQAEADNTEVPLSVRRIRSSRRAGIILDRIKHGSPGAKAASKENASGALVDDTASHPSRSALESSLGQMGPPEFVLSGPNRPAEAATLFRGIREASERQQQQQQQQALKACTTPETKPRLPEHSTPYRMLLALSDASSDPRRGEDGTRGSQGAGVDDHLRTPVKQTAVLSDAPTPASECRQRIESLRRFFCEPGREMVPGGLAAETKAATGAVQRNGNMLISFDTVDRQVGDDLGPLSLQLSQMSSIRQADEPVDLLQSPLPPCTVGVTEGMPDILERRAEWGSASSLLLSFTSRHQEQDLDRPVPFVLDKAAVPDPGALDIGEQPDLIGLSSRLNASISALNHGLREHMARTSTALVSGGDIGVSGGNIGMSGGDIGAAAGAIEKVGTELCQSLASLAPKVDNLVDASPGARSTAPSELEDQLCTLRKTMEDTKAIVFEIQAQLGQGRAKEGTKLDDIARLLGALDMRLHMLEDRQRLDSSVGSPAVGSAAAPKRGNAGSTKVRVSSSPPRDLAGRAGQLVVHCLTQYPLMIIGALLVILVSELLVIGGIGPDMQSVRELGRSAVAAIRNHIGGSQPPT